MFNLSNDESGQRASVTQPTGEPEQASSSSFYFVVIGLFAFAFSVLANLFEFEFGVQVVQRLANVVNPNSLIVLGEIESFSGFLIRPCLFFLVLYWYGRQTGRLFRRGYLGPVPFLIFGSALGYLAYVFSTPLLGSSIGSLDGVFWLGIAFGMLSEAVTSSLIGMAALALSYVRNPPLPLEVEDTGPVARA
ncbi:MAG: hypothetical protein ABSF83_03540 [Nitrososphaerales archaeon]|jgi:hypothetical protein